MKFTTLTIILCLISAPFYGQKLIHQNKKIINLEGQNIAESDFFQTYENQFQIDSKTKFTKKYSNIDKNGTTHTKYRQFYKNIPVLGGEYILHSQDGIVVKSTGNIYPIKNLDTNPTIDKITAQNIVESIWHKKNHDKNENQPPFITQLITKFDKICIIGANTQMNTDFRLAYSIYLYNTVGTIYEQYFIDAHTGEYLHASNNIDAITVPSKGNSLFYGEVEFNADSIGPNQFILRDLSKGDGIFVESKWYGLKEYASAENFWSIEDYADRSAIDAFYCASAYYDFLQEQFNRNSLDDKGMALICDVNRKNSAGAYWFTDKILVGGGDCYNYYPFSSLSVIGHEFTHGLLNSVVDFIYFNESRAIKEGISDIFGNALEYYKDFDHFDWYIGSKVTKRAKGLRSMKDPNELQSAKYYQGEYWNNENIGYTDGRMNNNGVLNYWYYLIVEGKSGTNEVGTTYNVEGIGMDKALQLVYHTVINYITPDIDYRKMYLFTLEAAKDLYGKDSKEYNSVVEAWKAVGFPEHLPSDEINPDRFDFSLLINGRSDFLNFFCYDEIQNMNIGFKNKGAIILKKGTTVKLTISPFENKNNITFYPQKLEKTLDKDLGIGDTLTFEDIELNFQNLDTSAVRNFVPIYNDVTIENETIYHQFHDIASIDLLKTHENYTADLYLRIFECDNKFENISLWFGNFNACNGYSPSDIATIKIYNDNNESHSIKTHLNPSFLNSSIKRNLENEFDFSSIENLQDYYFDLYYNDVFVKTDTFSKYFFRSVGKDDVIDFSDDTYTQHLDISRRTVTYEVVNGNLHLNNKWRPTNFNTCYSFENYHKIYNDRNSDRFDINFCTDISNMNEPVLSFDLEMVDNPRYGAFTQKLMHTLKLYQGNEPMDQDIIATTDNEYKNINIPLDKAKSGKIDLNFIIQGTSVNIDNIKVFDKNPVATLNIENNTFVVTNPIQNRIQINVLDQNLIWNFDLFDVNGRKLVSEKNIIGNFNKDVSNYSAGLYFYRIESQNKEVFTGKIVIVK